MRFDLTVNEFTMEMLTKKHLQVFGEQFWRPYIHVRDAARAIHLVLSSPAAEVGGTCLMWARPIKISKSSSLSR